MSLTSEALNWPDAIKIGVGCIDEQHQILANMIDAAELRLAENSNRLEIEEFILDLMSYALYHFDTEEQLMLDHGYDPIALEKHCQEHRSFSATIAQFQQELKLGRVISRDELLQFVKDWLIFHMLCTDRKFGEFMMSINKTVS